MDQWLPNSITKFLDVGERSRILAWNDEMDRLVVGAMCPLGTGNLELGGMMCLWRISKQSQNMKQRFWQPSHWFKAKCFWTNAFNDLKTKINR